MKRPVYSLAYIQALQTYSRIVSQSKTRRANHVTGRLNTVTTVQEGIETYSPDDVTIVDSTILQKLSHRASVLSSQIISELKFNNALWYFDHTLNKRDLKAIKELRDLGVLSSTEDTRIHFVNPDYIRKGNKLLVAANTAMVTATCKVCKTMIRPLNKKHIELNPMHLTELT